MRSAESWVCLSCRPLLQPYERASSTALIIATKLVYAMQFARDLDAASADKFVGMYVNERTLDYGADGREAVHRLLDMGHKAGIIGPEAKVDWV